MKRKRTETDVQWLKAVYAHDKVQAYLDAEAREEKLIATLKHKITEVKTAVDAWYGAIAAANEDAWQALEDSLATACDMDVHPARTSIFEKGKLAQDAYDAVMDDRQTVIIDAENAWEQKKREVADAKTAREAAYQEERKTWDAMIAAKHSVS